MNGELIGRLLMVLVGFVLALLGVIVFIHSNDHALLGVLISFSGIVSILLLFLSVVMIFGGLQKYE